jgi:hypothetical protein
MDNADKGYIIGWPIGLADKHLREVVFITRVRACGSISTPLAPPTGFASGQAAKGGSKAVFQHGWRWRKSLKTVPFCRIIGNKRY